MHWFDVDKAGLAKLLKRNGAAFVIRELWSNAIDEKVTQVTMAITAVPNRKRMYDVVVQDDSPEGFANLKDSFTLFAESKKKSNPSLRGRFNLGEKLVLAVCEEASIQSTKGEIRFDRKGRHESYHPSSRLRSGTIFRGVMPLTQEDLDEINKQVRSYIVPDGVTAFFNGQRLDRRTPVATTGGVLDTEVDKGDGVLHRTKRRTVVEVYEPLAGYKAALYELGVPVVETGDRYDVNVNQKIPLNMDRDNVPPAYLQDVRTLVLNQMYRWLNESDANSEWARNAAADERCEKDAVKKVKELRFGTKAVIFDPSDLEANNRAASQGYTVIHGTMMSKEEWDNIKRDDIVLPAGQVIPTPKPFSPNGKPIHIIPETDYNDDLRYAVKYAKRFARFTIERDITVLVTDDKDWQFRAAFSRCDGRMFLNYRILKGSLDSTNEDGWQEYEALLIHELGHHFSSDHLSDDYHRGLCIIGAKARRYATLIVSNIS